LEIAHAQAAQFLYVVSFGPEHAPLEERRVSRSSAGYHPMLDGKLVIDIASGLDLPNGTV